MQRLNAETRSLAWLLLLLVAGTLIGFVLPPGEWFRPGNLLFKASAWDAEMYQEIARIGYRDANTGGWAQRIAFFPGYALVLRGLNVLAGEPVARVLSLFVSAGIGIASVFAFGRLARAVAPPDVATFAIILYTLYPGAHFMFQPYATGTIELCTILALYECVSRRPWRAAAIIGLATGFGPLAAFPAAAIVLWWLIREWPRRSGEWPGFIASLAAMSVLALSGLLTFMLYQQLAFDNALAFVEAGHMWEQGLGLGARLFRAAAYLVVVPDILRAAYRLFHSVDLLSQGQTVEAQVSYEDAMDLSVLFLISVGAVASFRLKERVLTLAALFTLFGFIWFAGAPQGGQATIRLIYPAIGAFFGLALLTRNRPRCRTALIVFFAFVLFVDQAFVIGGYWAV